MFLIIRSLMCGLLLVQLVANETVSAERRVSVSGSGIMQVPPDEVVIGLELKAVDDDLVRVRTQSDKQVQAMIDLAKKHGTKEGDFKISKLSLGLSYNDQLKRPMYHVEREMSVKLDVLANLNALLADLLKQTDTTVGDITFGVNKASDHQREARRRAVADAKATATDLAALSDLKLGKALEISSYGESERPFVTSVSPVVGQKDPFSSRRKNPLAPGGGGFFFVANAPGDDQKPAETGSFGLGLIEFTATVEIVFELLE